MPSTNLHVDTILTEYAVGYMRDQSTYIANVALPPVKSDKQSNRYHIYSRNDFARDEAALRAPGAEAAATDFSLSTDTFTCSVYALKAPVTWRERDASDDPAGLEQAAVDLVSDSLLLRRERLFYATAMLNTSWDSGNRLVGHASTNTGSNFLGFGNTGADPVQTMLRAHDLVRQGTNGRKGNTIIVTPDVHRTFLTNASIMDRIKYGGTSSSPAAVTESTLAQMFGVEKYLVVNTAYASNAQGATAAYSDLGTQTMLLAYINNSRFSPTAMRQFSWSAYDKAISGTSVVRYDDIKTQSTWIETEIAPAFEVTAGSAAVHFASCLA